jgi:hypothetical protein
MQLLRKNVQLLKVRPEPKKPGVPMRIRKTGYKNQISFYCYLGQWGLIVVFLGELIAKESICPGFPARFWCSVNLQELPFSFLQCGCSNTE